MFFQYYAKLAVLAVLLIVIAYYGKRWLDRQ